MKWAYFGLDEVERHVDVLDLVDLELADVRLAQLLVRDRLQKFDEATAVLQVFEQILDLQTELDLRVCVCFILLKMLN